MSARSVILASRSPRRRELMKLLGIDFAVVPPPDDTDDQPGSSDARELTKLRAALKAQSVAAAVPGAAVVGADTIVWIEGQALGKPKDARDAARMLRSLSGRTHEVFTGVAVSATTGRNTETRTGLGSARVTFGALSDSEISSYLETGEPLDKAGAYGIQGRACVFVERIEGCYFSVVGLPISELVRLLREFGVRILGEPV